VTYPYEGKLLNLGIYKKSNSFVGKLRSLRAFRNYLKQESIEVIIDHRTRVSRFKEWIYGAFIYQKIPLILVAHSANLEMYFTSNTTRVYKNIKAIVGVSTSITKRIRQQLNVPNVETIHNAIPSLEAGVLLPELPLKYILSYGRMVDEVKNYTLLLDAFAKAYSQLQLPLVLMGSGPDGKRLKEYAKNLGMEEQVVFIPNQPRPKLIIEKALCVTLTSRFEGFPMVLVEALSLGVPVVSVDCDSGPAELIVNGKNGLLVKNNDIHIFAQALIKIGTQKGLREQLSKNAISSVTFLETRSIAAQWEKLLSSI